MNQDKKTRRLKVRIPAWLPDIDGLAEQAQLNPHRLRAIIHQFFLAWVKDKRIEKTKDFKDENRLPDHFPVMAELLKEIGSEHYACYVRFLESIGVIARHLNDRGNSCYLAGKHCTLYTWIKPEDLTGNIPFRTEYISDPRAIKSILKCRDRHMRDKVRIASTSATQFGPVYEQLRQFTEQVVFLPGFEQPLCSDEDDLFTESVMDGSTKWHTVCAFGNRYHNQFTTLPKKSRSFIRFKGYEDTPLITLDFSNSQPYFSAIIGCGTILEELLREFLAVLPVFKSIEHNEDYQKYRNLCATGKLYQHFENEARMTKDEVKERLFKSVLFAKKKVYNENKTFQDKFRQVFPSVLQMAFDIKKMNEKDLPLLRDIIKPPGVKFKDEESNYSHKIIPAMMQRAESRIVFGSIVPAMLAACIGPLLTVHDSFIILPEHEQQTREIIGKAFEKFGIPPPNVKCEPA